MFAGHVGVAMALGRAERRVNLGAFVLAALLMDVALWSFVLLGWESLAIPPDLALRHQPDFVFPYSHGLLASLGWSVLAGLVAYGCYPRLGAARARAAILVGATVFSHWLLDALVHAPELPLLGSDSTMIGVGLWQFMPVALALEALIALVGLALFLRGAGLPAARRAALAVLALLVLALTIVGMTVAPAPPSATAMAASSLVTIVLLVALVSWLARRR
jgi:hypothetical protein